MLLRSLPTFVNSTHEQIRLQRLILSSIPLQMRYLAILYKQNAEIESVMADIYSADHLYSHLNVSNDPYLLYDLYFGEKNMLMVTFLRNKSQKC